MTIETRMRILNANQSMRVRDRGETCVGVGLICES